MKRAAWLKIINLLLAIDFVVIATAAIFHDRVIRLGIYEQLHVLPGFAFLVLVVSHVILNRGWIKSTYFKKKKAPSRD